MVRIYRTIDGRYRAKLEDEPGQPEVTCDDPNVLEQLLSSVEAHFAHVGDEAA